MIYVVLVIGMLGCAVFAVRATRLLPAALWLAGVSVMTAIILYLIGAYMMAVIELSLSVGLITILLVFAISMAGADSPDQPVSRLFFIPLVAVALLLIIGFTIPGLFPQSNPSEASFTQIFWTLREADVLAQIALIFAGVLGVLALLAEPRRHRKGEQPHEAAAEMDVQAHDIPSVETEPEPERELEAV